MRRFPEIMILLVQLAGVILVCYGLWMVWQPLAAMFAGGVCFWAGRRLWQELDEQRNEEDKNG